jgi:integrase
MTHTTTTPDIPAPPDATEVFAWTQHAPDLARRPFTGAVREVAGFTVRIEGFQRDNGDVFASGDRRNGAGWLFPNSFGDPITANHIAKIAQDALSDGWTLHTLRHRFASRAYRGTRNLRAVQALMGHSSIATTERYLAVDDDEVRAAILAAL